MSKLLFLDFYVIIKHFYYQLLLVIIKLLLPEQNQKANRVSKKVAWTAVSPGLIPLKGSGKKC